MRVAVAVDGEVTTRAAQSLSTHPDVEVVLLAPATSSQFEVVDSPQGCAAVFGGPGAGIAAAAAGLPAVTTSDDDPHPGVRWASVEGLALALAGGLDHVERVAVAVPGEAAGDDAIVFPSPIDGRRGERRTVGGREVYVAEGEGPLAAALALGGSHHRVIVDEHRFLQGIALAAGIGIVLETTIAAAVPVWERWRPYLRTAADMGLVIGERAA